MPNDVIAGIDVTQFERRADQPEQRPGTLGGVRVGEFEQFDTGGISLPDRTVPQEFGRGVNYGTQNLQAGLYGFAQLLGQLGDNEALIEFGRAGAQRNIEEGAPHAGTVPSLADVEGTEDFFRFAASGLGQALPTIALSIGGGGIGGAAARRATASSIKRLTLEAAVRDIGEQATAQLSRAEIAEAVSNALKLPAVHQLMLNASRRGAAVGAAAPTTPIEAGGIVSELDERGLEAPGTALVGGALAGALDAAPTVALLDRVFPGVDRQISRGFVQDLATAMGGQAALEGSTEAAQEMVAMAALAFHDPTFDPFDEAGRMRLVDAAAIGALAGMASGGAADVAGGAVRAGRDTRNRVRNGGGVLASFIASKIDANTIHVDAEGNADTGAFPGWAEAVDRVVTETSGMVNDVTSSIREQVAAAMDNVRQDIPGADTRDAAARVDRAEARISSLLGPDLDRLSNRLRSELTDLRERAKKVAGEQREEYVATEVSKIMERVTGYIQERVQRIVSVVEKETTEKFDADYLEDPDDVLAGLREEAPTEEESLERLVEPKFVIGQYVRERYSLGRGNLTRAVRTRSRGDDAVPFGSREAAETAAAEVRASYPTVNPDAIDVVEVDGGFAVGIRDAGSGEEIFEQQRLNDTLTKSAAIARARDARKPQNAARMIQIRRPGQTDPTWFDLPTLAFGGRDVAERGGTSPGADRPSTTLRGLDTALARLVDQGYEIVGGMEGLSEKLIMPGITVRQARSQFRIPRSSLADLNPEEQREALEKFLRTSRLEESQFANTQLSDTTPVAERGAASTLTRGQQGAEQELIDAAGEQSTSETEARQATRSARARGSAQFTQSPSNKNVRVGILGKSQELRDRVAKLVSDVASIAGMSDQNFFVVDRKGAEALLQSTEFTQQQKAVILQAIANDENGKIHGAILHGKDPRSKRRIIYLSERALANQRSFFRTLFHEMGHAVQRVHFDALTDAEKAAMDQAWMDSGSSLDFDEWMADQFVGWAVREGNVSQASRRFANPTFLERVTKLLKAVWQKLRERFGVTDTYEDFMRGALGVSGQSLDVNEWGKAILRSRFANQGRAAHPGKMFMDIQNLEVAPEGMARAKWAQLRQRINQRYPRQMQGAEAMWRSVQRVNDQWFSSLNGVLRRMGLNAATKLAEKFNKTPGAALKQPLYFDELQRNRARFMNRFEEILSKIPEDQHAAVLAELQQLNGREGEHTNPHAIALRGVLDDMHQFMIEKGLKMEGVRNYFPKIWDHEAVRSGIDEITQLLAAKGVSPQNIDRILEHMITHDGVEGSFQANMSPRADISGVPNGNFLKARGVVLSDPAFDKFLSPNLTLTLTNYVNGAVKRAEFNAALGQDARTVQAGEEWNPRQQLDDLLDEARREGATQEQLELMTKATEAMLGRYGRNTPEQARKVMAWLATYQNVRVLGFSQLASLPDLVGPAMRTGEYTQAFKVLRDQMKQITNSSSELNEAARVFGIISDTLNEHVLTEHMDTHWFPPMARKINNTFFRAIGMEKLNNFVRSYAFAVGTDFIERRAAAFYAGDLRAATDLEELGLTPSDVRTWQTNGKRVFGAKGYDLSQAGSESDQKVAQAMVRFVNEANMRPNPSQRPLMSSHPALMLIWHLKSFMFAFYDVFIRQIMENAAKAGTPWQKAYVVAVPAALLMAMTAAGLELRELIQYRIWGNAGRTDRMDGAEYLWEILQRSGLLGPTQLVVDWEEADERGNSGLVAIAGPTLSQLNELVNSPPGTSIPKALPGVNQIPELRDFVRGAIE